MKFNVQTLYYKLLTTGSGAYKLIILTTGFLFPVTRFRDNRLGFKVIATILEVQRSGELVMFAKTKYMVGEFCQCFFLSVLYMHLTVCFSAPAYVCSVAAEGIKTLTLTSSL